MLFRSWTDAVEAARVVATAVSAPLTVRAGQRAPWHPGRCAELIVGDRVVGFAGELHPRAIAALGLPPRTAAMELDLGPVLAAAPELVLAPTVSPFPVASQDVALVLDAAVPVAEVAAALDAGAGDLLESLRFFDVYTGDQVPPGHRSLAYSLRFRAPDRTLTVAETTAARDAAVAEAARRTGAQLLKAEQVVRSDQGGVGGKHIPDELLLREAVDKPPRPSRSCPPGSRSEAGEGAQPCLVVEVEDHAGRLAVAGRGEDGAAETRRVLPDRVEGERVGAVVGERERRQLEALGYRVTLEPAA